MSETDDRDMPVPERSWIDAGNGARLVVDVVGDGEPLLLLHGFPHTRAVWSLVTPLLTRAGLRVIAPDLRGTGESSRPDTGYDAETLARDQLATLDDLGIERAHVVGFDIGAAPAFTLAAAHPDRVHTLTLVEAIVGGLPGAQSAFPAGPPWWFGFHQVPDGLAEDVVQYAAERYIRFFLDSGSAVGVPAHLAHEFVRAYSTQDALRAAFDHYRAMPANARWAASWAETGRLGMPVTTVGGSVVKGALREQLTPFADDLRSEVLPDSGHIVPVDAPAALADVIITTVTDRRTGTTTGR